MFASLLKKTLEVVPNTAANLVSAFKKCGIYPLNKSEVMSQLPLYAKKTIDVNGAVSNSFLSYITTLREKELGHTE